jgi:hypothetical protein
VIDTSQTQSQTEQLGPAAPSKKSSRRSILALSVFAMGLNATAAAYTMSPSNFALPNVSGLVAELLPHEGASKPIPDAVVAALNDIQSDQQYIATALQDNGSSLQRNTALLEGNGSSLQRNNALLQAYGSLLQQNSALLQQDATKLDTLRSSLTDEHSDVKAISAQLSTLIAKVDSLQNAMTSEITSSIPKGRTHTQLSGVARKRLARSIKPKGPRSIGGAPLTTAPASVLGPLHNPAG